MDENSERIIEIPESKMGFNCAYESLNEDTEQERKAQSQNYSQKESQGKPGIPFPGMHLLYVEVQRHFVLLQHTVSPKNLEPQIELQCWVW